MSTALGGGGAEIENSNVYKRFSSSLFAPEFQPRIAPSWRSIGDIAADIVACAERTGTTETPKHKD